MRHARAVVLLTVLLTWLPQPTGPDTPQTVGVDLPDPLATAFAQLKCSRGLALARADWIIPGQGSMQPVRHASGS
jgi:hypothetical protein